MYFIGQANEYLAITGIGIDDVKIAKKAFIWPFQKFTRFAITPISYQVDLHAMTIEKLEFKLPVLFTVGPEDTPEMLKKYARVGLTNDKKNLDELVLGIVEGETRLIAASLTMEEIFKDRKLFKETVTTHISGELAHFGMTIYNANVKQLQDTGNSEYFKYLRLKCQEGAINKAKVDVALARKLGTVGEKEREGGTRKMTIKVESETMIFEQSKQIQMAGALSELKVMEAKFDAAANVANIEGQNKARLAFEQLQQVVEAQKVQLQKEKIRAVEISKAIVDAEIVHALADAEYYKTTTTADAHLYNETKLAESDRETFAAQANGIKLLQKAFHGENKAALNYLMIEEGLHRSLADINASAIAGLKPKITVWNNGTNDASPGDIRNLIQSLPPMLDTIQKQTGINAPKWLADMSQTQKK